MTDIPRRRLLVGSTLLASGFLLAACTASNNGGIHTVTVDTGRIVTDGKAIIATISAVLSIPSLAVALGSNYVLAQAALAAAQAALVEIENLTGGSVTTTLDTTRLQTLVTTLLNNVQTALMLVQGAVAKLAGSDAAKVGTYVSAALSLIPFLQLAAGFASARPDAASSMSEADALRVARGL